MTSEGKLNLPILIGLLLAFGLGGCGWAEFPAPSTVWDANPPRPATSAPRRSDSVFVEAEAVTVGRGDTIYRISRRHHVSPREIIDANKLTPPYKLSLGQRLVLPRARKHKVKRDDTLYGISRRYGVSTNVLARVNGLGPPYTIFVGQDLRIPAGTATTRQTAPQTAEGTGGKPAPAVTMTQPRPKPARNKPASPVAKPPSRSGGGFLWPAQGKIVSRYGAKSKGLHNDGINIAAPQGTPVRASENGIVAYAGNEIRGFGNLLLIKHDGGWITAYAHNEELLVKRGDKIKKGQLIARVGSTGNVATSQLHFEIRRGRRAVDPIKHLTLRKVSLSSGPITARAHHTAQTRG